jgi:Mlc titration factor MtfA (ptsG expression regulator)
MSDLVANLLRLGGLLAAGALVVGYLVGRDVLRRRRRLRLASRPLPEEWPGILERNVPIYRRLPQALRADLHGHINVFMAEHRFEGCGGMRVTDLVRATLAAQACVLVLGRKEGYRRTLGSILVYPHAFVVSHRTAVGGGGQIVAPQARLGESWRYGEVVLAWDEVPQGPEDGSDGRNVVLHEFAHQLDHEDGFADGMPTLDRRSDYANWSRVLGARYEELRESVEAAREDEDDAGGERPGQGHAVLDAYGATNPAEFFAVATEAFFEKPEELKVQLPDLYEQLQHYYKLDPAVWPRLRT